MTEEERRLTEQEKWQGWLTELAKRYQAAFQHVRSTDYENSYVLEGHAVAEMATVISAGHSGSLASAGIVLEGAFYRYEAKHKARRADLWYKNSLSHDKTSGLFVEVKLGGLSENGMKIGQDTAKTIKSYADDVWRLLCLTHRKGAQSPTECAFVIVAFADVAPDKALTHPLRLLDRGHNEPVQPSSRCADGAQKKLYTTDSLAKFLECAAGEKVGAQVSAGDLAPVVPDAKGEQGVSLPMVRCYALRWLLNEPWDTGRNVQDYP